MLVVDIYVFKLLKLAETDFVSYHLAKLVYIDYGSNLR